MCRCLSDFYEKFPEGQVASIRLNKEQTIAEVRLWNEATPVRLDELSWVECALRFIREEFWWVPNLFAKN
jgi:hypothetical protein